MSVVLRGLLVMFTITTLDESAMERASNRAPSKGIPMALAGFVAGLAINQSRDTEEVRKAILPFRDLFAI